MAYSLVEKIISRASNCGTGIRIFYAGFTQNDSQAAEDRGVRKNQTFGAAYRRRNHPRPQATNVGTKNRNTKNPNKFKIGEGSPKSNKFKHGGLKWLL
jgi:hypothetical protein